MKKKFYIAVLPGDGIGPEVMKQAYKILNILQEKCFLKIVYQEYDIGGIAIDRFGTALPQKTLLACEKSDAILLGSVGGPKWSFLPDHQQPERAALLKLRKHFNLFANIRPARLYPELKNLSPLRSTIVNKGIDILCIRELTGGIYFGDSKRNITINSKICAFDTEIYYKFEIERITRLAFEIARTRQNKITSIDKANVLQSSKLWREVVNTISQEYPDVHVSHLYIDNAVMQIIQNPNQFDVILCSNLFGDILSDECASIIGSIGMLASASLNENNFGLYEPAGGSAPDITGKNIANPIAQILSVALLLQYSMKLDFLSESIYFVIKKVLQLGYRTFDITENKKDYVNTDQMGDIISKLLIKEI
ncbi:3-isopropylmalate dehydrogenase [Buchnera aphidicola (Pterocallis alni)]|uniref:3-isopropylmalate dehydrogenase n=1 Tax=Buchnera aphidicola TaxID=9 RepID=UPI003463FF04